MNMKECPGCHEMVSRAAAACPKCGNPIKAKTSPLAMGCGVLILLGFGFSVCVGSGLEAVSEARTKAKAEVKISKSKPVKISNLTFDELDEIYSLSSKRTDLQKDEYWKGYKGQRVQWSGEVTDISKGFLGGLSLQIKMKPSTFVSDLIIELRKDQESKALKISQGDTITFTGTLNRWGSIMPISLNDGVINSGSEKKR